MSCLAKPEIGGDRTRKPVLKTQLIEGAGGGGERERKRVFPKPTQAILYLMVMICSVSILSPYKVCAGVSTGSCCNLVDSALNLTQEMSPGPHSAWSWHKVPLLSCTETASRLWAYMPNYATIGLYSYSPSWLPHKSLGDLQWACWFVPRLARNHPSPNPWHKNKPTTSLYW